MVEPESGVVPLAGERILGELSGEAAGVDAVDDTDRDRLGDRGKSGGGIYRVIIIHLLLLSISIYRDNEEALCVIFTQQSPPIATSFLIDFWL